MQDGSGREAADSHRPEGEEDHRPGSGGRGSHLAGGALRRRGRGAALRQPGINPPVDLVTDPLDQALGHGMVVGGAQLMVRGARSGNLVTRLLVHVDTIRRDRADCEQAAGSVSGSFGFPFQAGSASLW